MKINEIGEKSLAYEKRVIRFGPYFILPFLASCGFSYSTGLYLGRHCLDHFGIIWAQN